MSAPTDPHVMACMEVWGGNRAIDNGVTMHGLDAWVFSNPYMAADSSSGGGDIHYVTACAGGRITRLIVADVSGHGAPVAKAAESLRRLMCRYSNYIDQTRFVEAVNERFGELAAEAGDADASMFATAVVATYFAPTDELTICIAGHPRPLRYEARTKTWSRIDAASDSRDSRDTRKKPMAQGPENLPLGILEPTRYPLTSLRLGRDDLVLFYTDSLMEAKGVDGLQLGEAGMIRILSTLDAANPQSLVREFLAAIERDTPVGSDRPTFDDDVTALLIRRNDLKPRPSLGLALVSTWRILAHAAKSLLPGGLPASFPQMNIRAIGGAMMRRLNG